MCALTVSLVLGNSALSFSCPPHHWVTSGEDNYLPMLIVRNPMFGIGNLFFFKKEKNSFGAEMAQWVWLLAAKLANLCLASGTHLESRELQLLKMLLCCCSLCEQPHIHI